MAKSLQEWQNKVFNTVIDLDNSSFDCVDVFKSWAEYLTGIGWQTSAGWGNAKDIWFNAPTKYWARVNKYDLKPGDAICMDGTIGGGYGHVAVVVERVGNNVVVYQQNTFTQQPVYKGTYTVSSSYIQGGLRPTVAFTVGTAPAQLQPYQRTVSAGGTNYRVSPSRSGSIIKLYAEGEVLDFKGYVTNGEAVDGNSTWFVGMHTGGYAWSNGFTNASTTGLNDLTPATLQPHQRQVAGDVINYRRAPELMPDNVIKTFAPGEVLDFDGWIEGAFVNGSNVWFRGKYTGGYSHSGGFTNQTTDGLPQLTTQAPAPAEPVTEMFVKELACVTKVVPAHPSNYEVTNFPSKPTGVVLHDFGTDGRDTFTGSLAHFQNKDTTAPHLVISGDEIVQTGKLSWRMYHAGKLGNDKIGIEIDPDVDTNPKTKASVELAIKALEVYFGVTLTRHTHDEFMATLCGDDVRKAGLIDAPTPEPTEPTPTPDPATPQPTNPAEPLPPIEPTPVKPSTRTLEGILAIVTNVLGWATIFFSSLVLPEGTPVAIVNGLAFVTLLITNINLAIQRTKLKQTAIEQTIKQQ